MLLRSSQLCVVVTILLTSSVACLADLMMKEQIDDTFEMFDVVRIDSTSHRLRCCCFVAE